MRVLMVGNPNVGKSSVFHQVTGVSVMTSNYPGTTVEYTRGSIVHNGVQAEILDTPGIYDLDPHNETARTTISLLSSCDVILNVVDATNLERNLNLTLSLIELGKPMVIALNMWDDTVHKGIRIDADRLSEILGLEVMTTSGRTGEGLDGILDALLNARSPSGSIMPESGSSGRWEKIGKIIAEVQNLTNRRHTRLERLQDLTMHPIWGVPAAVLLMCAAFYLIIRAGEAVTAVIRNLFETAYTPAILFLDRILPDIPLLHAVLLGEIGPDGPDYETAMGVLTTGVFVIFGIVLPYVILFYLVLGFLEDLGYLPRAAVVFDRLLHRVGVHGYSIIPMLLGCGCNVPGILAVRNLESRRERFITAVLTATAIPCMAQTAVITRILGRHGTGYVILFLASLASVWFVLGRILAATVKGTTPSLLLEMPPYRMPAFRMQMKKLGIQIRCFLTEAVPYLLGGIAVISLLKAAGIIGFLGRAVEPVITGLFGLPAETVSSLILGIVRKDAAVVLLEPLGLSAEQTVTAVLVLILYSPCAAAIVVLFRELGAADLARAGAVMCVATLAAGGILRFLLSMLPGPITAALSLIALTAATAALMRPVCRHDRVSDLGRREEAAADKTGRNS